jgi:hypothetical protein
MDHLLYTLPLGDGGRTAVQRLQSPRQLHDAGSDRRFDELAQWRAARASPRPLPHSWKERLLECRVGDTAELESNRPKSLEAFDFTQTEAAIVWSGPGVCLGISPLNLPGLRSRGVMPTGCRGQPSCGASLERDDANDRAPRVAYVCSAAGTRAVGPAGSSGVLGCCSGLAGRKIAAVRPIRARAARLTIARM